MHPYQRALRVSMRLPPRNQPVSRAAPAGHAGTELRRERRYEVNEWTSEVNTDVVDVLIEGHGRKYAYLRA